MRADRSAPDDSAASRRAGRPRASSRAMLEEAAGELFLEQGFAATSVADIAQRAGVSRSSFFNYFPAKSDLLWAAFDDQVAQLRIDLAEPAPATEPAPTLGTGARTATREHPSSAAATQFAHRARTALLQLAAGLPSAHVALAFTQAEAMGLSEELRLACARRVIDVADTLTGAALTAGLSPLHARVAGSAWAGALIAAVHAWALAGADRTCLPDLLATALCPVSGAFDLDAAAPTTS